jgi:hypothetical protein
MGRPSTVVVRCNEGEKLKSALGKLPEESFFGKCVDEIILEVLPCPLSLNGTLFEIYFVRLIGTPNQNSKNVNPASAGFRR